MLITTQLTQADDEDIPFLIGDPALPATKGNQKRKVPAQYGAPTTKISKAAGGQAAKKRKQQEKQRMQSMFMHVFKIYVTSLLSPTCTSTLLFFDIPCSLL